MDRIPVIIDSDIGDDITDTTAIIFALKSPKLEIKAILSNNNYEKERALILDKLVRLAGKEIPVLQGVEGGTGALRGQEKFIDNYEAEIEKLENNVDFIEKLLKSGTKYVSDGTLTNPNYLLEKIPREIKKTEFHVMAGAIDRNYEGENEPVSEWNIQCDVPAAQNFFDCSAPVNLYPLDCSWNLEITDGQMNEVIAQNHPLNRALKQQFDRWRRTHERNVVEYDSLLMAAVIRPELIKKWEDMKLVVDEEGITNRSPAGKQVRVALEVDQKKFNRFFLNRMLES